LPIKDDDIEKLPYLKFEEGSPELTYMRAAAQSLGGFTCPRAVRSVEPLPVPSALGF
jgi:pyruvate dehydrogenase E1 component